jgi:hypothetical protein
MRTWPFIAVISLAGCYSAPAALCTPGARCKTLVIQNGGTGDLMGVPLLVELDANAIDYAAVGDPTTDLRFHDATTDQDLPFEVDRWVTGGVSDVWIRVPALTGHGPFTNITMEYGADAHGMADPAAVWSDFALVAHLGDGQLNAASAAYAPLPMTVTTGDGKIGGAVQLAGTSGDDERVDFQGSEDLLAGWSTFTVELWVWPDYATSSDLGNQPAIFQKQGTFDGGRLFDASGAPLFQADISFDNPSTEYLNTDVALRDWTYLVYTYDNSVLNLYANGALQKSQDKPSHAALTSTTNPFFLGSDNNPRRGRIAVGRGAWEPRSADWILEQYLSAQRLLVTFSP